MVQLKRSAQRDERNERSFGSAEVTRLQNAEAITKEGFEDKKKACSYGREQHSNRE